MSRVTRDRENRALKPKRDLLLTEIAERMAAMRGSARQAGFRHLLGQSISLTHLHILDLVRSKVSMSIGELARTLDISVASATGVVSRMEERGLVHRTRDAEDRRVVNLELANGGDAALEEIEGRGQEYFGGLLRSLTVRDLEHLRSGFAALQRASQRVRDDAAELRPPRTDQRMIT